LAATATITSKTFDNYFFRTRPQFNNLENVSLLDIIHEILYFYIAFIEYETR